MDKWVFHTPPLTAREIQEQCVRNPEWQKERLSLKGLPTTEKLDRLAAWQAKHLFDYPSTVQVTNYINALKRGGQLDLDCNVRR